MSYPHGPAPRLPGGLGANPWPALCPVPEVAPSMRDRVIARIHAIKDGHGKDLFTDKRNRRGEPRGTTMACRYHVDEVADWERLNDRDLLAKFEELVMLSYRQR